MKLKMALEEKEVDLRLRDRKIQQGLLTKDQVNKYLKDIPEEKNYFHIGEKEDKSKQQ